MDALSLIHILVDGRIVRRSDGRVLKTLGELAAESLYSLEDSQHITAETTAQIKSNAYSFGCAFAEGEVDIPMCRVKLLNLVKVHDCGTLINPALAEAQVHGGMSMAIGYGLSEELKFDERTGKPPVSYTHLAGRFRFWTRCLPRPPPPASQGWCCMTPGRSLRFLDRLSCSC